MTIITWIMAWGVMGLIAGIVSTKLVDGGGGEVFRDVLIGVIGALGGGIAFYAAVAKDVTSYNLWSLFVSALGAGALLIGYHAVQGHHLRSMRS